MQMIILCTQTPLKNRVCVCVCVFTAQQTGKTDVFPVQQSGRCSQSLSPKHISDTVDGRNPVPPITCYL